MTVHPIPGAADSPESPEVVHSDARDVEPAIHSRRAPPSLNTSVSLP
jgi:hypothetical protein